MCAALGSLHVVHPMVHQIGFFSYDLQSLRRVSIYMKESIERMHGSSLTQQSFHELDVYINEIAQTVRLAVGAPVVENATSPPPAFRKELVGRRMSSLHKKKSSLSGGGGGAMVPPGGEVGSCNADAELLRLQKENAELLLLVAGGEKVLDEARGASGASRHVGVRPIGGKRSAPDPQATHGSSPSTDAASWMARFDHVTPAAAAASPLSPYSQNASDPAATETVHGASPPTFREQEAVAVLTNTLREARVHACTALPPHTFGFLEEEDKVRALAPHRRSMEAALARLLNYVFAAPVVYDASKAHHSVAATQTENLVGRDGCHYLFVPYIIGPASTELRAAVQRAAAVRDVILSAALPLPAEGSASNVTRLSSLLQYHRDGASQSIATTATQAGPLAVALLERFLQTPRRPLDFREGTTEKFCHNEDVIVAAYPCVYFPTTPPIPLGMESPPSPILECSAWLFVCKSAVYLLVDVADSTEQLEQDIDACMSRENLFGTKKPPRSSEELHRSIEKRRQKRRERIEACQEQYKDDTLLIQLAEFSNSLVTLDLGQGSTAFAKCAERDAHPVLLDFGTCPRLDALMALCRPSGVRVEAAEIGRQLYASMVVQCHRYSPLLAGGRLDTTTYSLVFLSETDRAEMGSFLWAALHPARVSGDLFSPARSVPSEAMPICFPASDMGTLAKQKAAASSARIRGVDPVLLLVTDPTHKPAAWASGSPMLQYSEPVHRSTHSDWFPMHTVLTENELEFCRKSHVHPVALQSVKKTLLMSIENEWVSLFDVAMLLMAFTNAEHPCLVTAERVMEHLCGLYEGLDNAAGAGRSTRHSFFCEMIDVVERLSS